MDELLARAGSQAVTFAVKSGVSLASTYAIKTISNFIIQIPKDDAKNIVSLKAKLEDRIEIVSSAIDLIKLVAARGNTNLQSTLKITQNLKVQINQFEDDIQGFLEEVEKSTNQKSKSEAINTVENYIKDLLRRIEEVTPYINLALTTSGANLSTTLPRNVSPGLLLQASNYVSKNNTNFEDNEVKVLRVGPIFEVTLFSIFYNVNSENHVNWKEDMKRAFVEVQRFQDNKNKDTFKYRLLIKQSFDDERYHNTDEEGEVPKTLSFETDAIQKLFFSISGKLLKLEERDSGVLVLKVQEKKEPNNDSTSNMSFNWYAFGDYEYTETSDSDDDDDKKDGVRNSKKNEKEIYSHSIALLEYIIRLISLQQNDQKSILEINDERLVIYLNDENPRSIKTNNVGVKTITKGIENINLNKESK